MSQVQIYDPRLGRSFETMNALTERRFCSLEWGFFVITGIDIDWHSRADLLGEAMAKTSKLGFVAVKPWSPYITNLFDSLKLAFPTTSEFEESLSAYFEPGLEAIERIFRLRQAHGQETSGEWCLGGCIMEFTPPKRASLSRTALWDFAHILGQPANIGWALELAEMRQSTFVVKPFEGFDDWLMRTGLGKKC
jgi:hypothetical protein